jgi:hypothetical protein
MIRVAPNHAPQLTLNVYRGRHALVAAKAGPPVVASARKHLSGVNNTCFMKIYSRFSADICE